MDVIKILAQLRQERSMLDEAIMALEGLARGSRPRRGRPRKEAQTTAASASAVARAASKRTISPEARQRMAEAQRRRWAQARAGQTESQSPE